MPQTTTVSKLAQKYGAKLDQAVKAHAADETDYGFIPLPAGITSGVAQLSKCYFEEYKTGPNQGQFYFRAQGVVQEPYSVKVNGVDMKVKGLITSIMEPCCDTKDGSGKVTSQEEHIQRILNHMRMLAGDEFTQGASGNDLESLAASLEQAAPYFKFTTSARTAQKDSADGKVKKGDQTGVWENWHGSKDLADYVPPAGEGHSDDQSGEVLNEDGSVPFDLDALELDAMSETDTSVASGNQLVALAVEAGMSEKDAKDAPTWKPVIKFIRENHPSQSSGDEPEVVDEPEGWKVGETCTYRPTDPATKKPVKNPVKCTIKALNEKKGTATLASGKASYKDVPLDKLELVAE